MTEGVLDAMISGYMATEQGEYVFGWQGGEPALMGVEFFRKVTDLQRRRAPPGAVVANGIQTNATLVDDALAAHLAEYKFLAGVSLDGPAELHDRYRRSADGRGSHADVAAGIERMRRHGVELNVLTLVSAANVAHGASVYRYLGDNGFQWHQYIPCIEFGPGGAIEEYAITGEQWGRFLCEVFDQWASSGARASVRLFDSVISRLAGGGADVCQMGRDCRQYFVVEHNGDVYPCDFFVEEKLKLGNVATHGWEALSDSAKYARFGARKSAVNAACADCEYFRLCAGDCPKYRPRTRGWPRTLSVLCAGWKRFYAHALPELSRLARGTAEISRTLP
jgi:uncharacterized protein